MFIVEMYGVPKEEPKNRFFDCGAGFWETALELGKANGWEPMGTVPEPSCMEAFVKAGNYQNDYEPIMWGYQKMVLRDDARNWADALEKALAEKEADKLITGSAEKHRQPFLVSDNMTLAEQCTANENPYKERIREFISFLKRGGFGFTWDD